MNDADARMRQARVRAAWIILVASVAGWPVSAWWVWQHTGEFDPFQQLMLFLSFAAIWLVSADLLTTAQVHRDQGEPDQQGDDS